MQGVANQSFSNRDVLRLSKSYDPRMLFNENRSFNVMTGISNILQQKNIATSYSGNSVQHSMLIPDNSVLDRRMYLRWPVQLTLTGTGSAGKLLQLGTNDGIRANPISAMISNSQCAINGLTVSTILSDYVQQLTHYEDGADETSWYSMSPSMPDKFQTYSDYSGYGANSNPLALYGVNTYQVPRGGHPITVVSDNGTTAIVRFVITEPIRLSPFNWLDNDVPGIVGAQTVNFNFNLNDFSRMWCHAYTSSGSETYPITSIIGQFYAAPELDYQTISPDVSVSISKDREYFYPYQDIQRYITTAQSLAPGASTTTVSNTIQLNAVPSRVYYYVRQRNADLLNTVNAWYNSDACANITNISVVFNNVSGLLSAASEQQLYAMSVKNGLQQSWPQWKQFNGSIACIEFASDLGLANMGLAPGTGGSYQIQASVTYNNPATSSNPVPSTTIMYDLYTVVVQDGTFSVRNNKFVTHIGILNSADVLAAIVDVNVPYVSHSRLKTVYGKGFFDSIGNFFSDVYHKGIKPAVKLALPLAANAAKAFAPEFSPLIDVGQNLANRALGSGLSGGCDYQQVQNMVHQALEGGKRVGRPCGPSKAKPKSKSKASGKSKVAALKKLLKGKGLSGGKMVKNAKHMAALMADSDSDSDY